MDYLSEIRVRAEAERLRAESLRNASKSAARWLASLITRITSKSAERRLVAELSQLDDRSLRDIGLDRVQLQNVAKRIVANENWRRDAA